jgi:Fe2+ or Zn2+ uptake regulation protein
MPFAMKFKTIIERCLEAAVEKKTEKISGMILDYLCKNPDAGDTLEGITRWWLNMERIDLSVKEVAQALESLMEQGVITINKNRGGTTLYKINKEP